MNIFVANIGNRDAAFNCGTARDPNFVTFSKQRRQDTSKVQDILGCEPGTRAVIAALSKRFTAPQKLQHLRFPILRPALEHTLDKSEERGGLDRIILIGTDQDPEEVPHHYPWDTIETAHLMRELLPLDLDLGPRLDTASVEVFPVTSHPHRFETAYRQLGGVFERFVGTGAHVYASVNGGIPALNTALRIRVLNAFGPRAHLIETDEPSTEQKRLGAEGSATFADSWPYRRDALLRIARDLLDAYEYGGLLDVLRRELSAEEKKRFQGTEALLRHAATRFNLDFENAVEILRDAVRDESLSDEVAKPYGETAKQGVLSLQRLYELFWTARIFFKRGDFSNLVVRSAMLAETVRRQLVLVLTGVAATSALVSPRELDRDLNERLDDAGVYKKYGKWKNNNLFLQKCIDWGADQLEDAAVRKRVDKIDNYIGTLRRVKDLRDEFVHQSEGIARSDLEHQFGKPKGLVSTLKGMVRAMKKLHAACGQDSKATANVYTRLNESVLNDLAR